jgi:hypothetical protein
MHAGSSPRWPASILLEGVRTALRAELRRQQRWPEPTDDTMTEAALSERVAASDELSELLVSAVRDGALRPCDARLVFETRILGARTADVARSTGSDVRAVRKRRQRAEWRLVNATSALAVA